jgi:hypothetical protein
MGGSSNGKMPGLQPGDRGSTPRPVHYEGRYPNWLRKLPAKQLPGKLVLGSIRRPSAHHGSMVKRRSHLGPNEEVQVQVLVELLMEFKMVSVV